MLIDDSYLRGRWGLEDHHFVKYRCNPDVEPPRLLAAAEGEDGSEGFKFVKRGEVGRLDRDMANDGKTMIAAKL